MWKTTPPIATAIASGYWRSQLSLFAWLGIFLLNAYSIDAQRNLTLYQLNAVPQSYSLNPGRMPLLSGGYVGIPVVSKLSGSYGNTSLTFGDLMFESGEPDDEYEYGENFLNSNDFAPLLEKLRDRNRLNMDLSASWLEFGWRIQRHFFHFQVSDHLQFQAGYPRDLFTLMNDLSQETIMEDGVYRFDGLGLHGSHYRSYSLGYTGLITTKLSAGLRLKWLSGFANVSTLNQNLRLETDSDSEFFNVRGLFDIYSSGLNTLANEPDRYWRGQGNNGIAFDFGANYQVNDRIDLFASVVNAGRINWRNDLTQNTLVAGNVQFSSTDTDAFEEEFNNFIDSLQTPSTFPLARYTTRLPTMAYIGGNYYFQPNTSIGLLLSPRFFEGETDWAFSVALQHRINRFLQATVNYSTFNQSAANVGFGLALNAGPVQLFAATDNILPIFNIEKARNLHFQAGLGLTFGQETRAEQMARRKADLKLPDELAIEAPIVRQRAADREAGLLPPPADPKEKSERPAKEKPASTAPAPAAQEPEELRPYVTLNGTARSGTDNSALPGLAVEVYRQLANGGEELERLTNFLNGKINLSLQRGSAYRIIVKKQGFAQQEIRVAASEMQGKNAIEKSVVLPVQSTAPVVEQPKTQSAPPPAAPAETAPASAISAPTAEKPTAATTPPPAAAPATTAPEIYSVRDMTDLRVSPASDARSIFRFPRGSRMTLLEKTNDTWWKVQQGGRIGYMRASALQRVE